MKMTMDSIQEQAETFLPDKTVEYSVFEFVSYFCDDF